MKKVLLIIVMAFMANILLTPVVLAEDSLKEATFNVQKYLKMDSPAEAKPSTSNDGQNSGYFNENGVDGKGLYKEYSPIVRLVLMILDIATKVIGSIAILLLIISGFIYMTSQGNQQSLEKARDILKYTIIGLLITFFSYIITLFVQSVLTVSV